MKKLTVVFAVLVIGFLNAQAAEEIEQFKKDDCDKLAAEIHNSVNETNSLTNKTHTFKTCDTYQT